MTHKKSASSRAKPKAARSRNLFLALALGGFSAAAQPEQAPAPSLIYHSPSTGYLGADAVVAVQDVKVEVAVDGTYWCVLAWDTGYMGLQQGGSGYYRHVHFSVWDPPDGGQTFLPTAPHPNTQGGRFGGEGTGVVTYHPYNWMPGVTYSFAVVVSPYEGGSQYKGYFLDPAVGQWRLLATVRRPRGPTTLGYVSSFLEDFAASRTVRRAGLFGNAWVQTKSGAWSNPRSAYFNASIPNASHKNYDGDVVGSMFRLETGGATVNDTPILTYHSLAAGSRAFPAFEPNPAYLEWDLQFDPEQGRGIRAIWHNSLDKLWRLQWSTNMAQPTAWKTLELLPEPDTFQTHTFWEQENGPAPLFLRLMQAP